MILSSGTGHQGLLKRFPAYRLEHRPYAGVNQADGPGGYDGWSDASVDEVVAELEEIYRDPGAARKVGLEAAALMADWSWQKQVPRLLSMLELYCP